MIHNNILKLSSFWIIFAIIIIAFVYFFFSIFMYVAISAVIMLISDPLVNKLSNLKICKLHIKIPRYVGALLILSLIIAFFTLIFILFIPLINNQIYSLRQIDLNYVKDNFYLYLFKIEQYYKSIYPNETKSVLELLQEKFITLINPKNIADTLNNTLLITGNIFITLFSIIFISFFFIKDKDLIKEKVFLLIPDTEKQSIITIIKNCKETLRRYFIGLSIQVAGIFICNYIGLNVMGIKNALLIATISAVLNIIPYIGPLMGIVFAFFIVTASYLNTDITFTSIYIKTFTIMLATQLLDNFILQPLIFSKSIKAHPLEIFVVVIAAGTLYGVVGMLIAIPAYSVIRISAKQILEDKGKI